MKNTIYIIAFLFLFSCEGFLDEEPVSFLSEEQFYKSVGDAEAAVNAAYQPFITPQYYGQQFFAQVNLKSEYANGRGSHAAAGRFELDQRNTERTGGIWQQAYISINRANNVLERVPQIDGDQATLNRIIAEARFLRALNYFNLVRLWSGVPILTEEVGSLEGLAFPKATEAEVYNQIISDLQAAIPNLKSKSAQSAPSDLFRATSGAAQTLLADVYLTNGQYNEAMSAAQQVINSGEYSLESSLQSIYDANNQTSSEDVFSIKFSRQQGFGTSIPAWIHNRNAGYSNAGFRALLGVTSSFLASWDQDDLRWDLNLYNGEDTQFLNNNEPILFKKYIDPQGLNATNHGVDYPVYRLVDAMYIYAEADLRADNVLSNESLEFINQIRRRGYGKDISIPDATVDFASGLSSDAYFDILFEERGKELLLEGKRWFDMIRFDKVEELVTSVGYTYDPKILLWPIPQEEIDNNEALSVSDQNPGY